MVSCGRVFVEMWGGSGYGAGMEIFAAIFAFVIFAILIFFTIIMYMFVGLLGALAFVAMWVLIYYAFTYESPGMSGPMRRDELNAFQAALADDDDDAHAHRVSRWEDKPRNGFRNRGYRKHIARKQKALRNRA